MTIRGRGLPAALGLLALTGAADAQPPIGSQSFAVAFENCLATIDHYAARISRTPEVIVGTTDFVSTRFRLPDVVVLITCERPTSIMTVTTVRPECELGEPC